MLAFTVIFASLLWGAAIRGDDDDYVSKAHLDFSACTR